MTNKQKNKIIDRAISFIENLPNMEHNRMAKAHIEELKLIKNENVFAKEPRRKQCDHVRESDGMVVRGGYCAKCDKIVT